MTPIYRVRIVLIVLALCAVLTVAPLASAQSDPLPMPGTEENRSSLFSRFGQFDETERSTRNPIGVTLATLDGVGNSITATEGGAPAQFTMRLNAQPAGTVNLRYYNTGVFIIQPKQLTFTPENWDTPQVVSVYGIMDYGGSDYTTQLSPYSYSAETITDGIYDTVSLSFNTFSMGVINTPRTLPTGPLVVTTLEDSITEEIPGSLRQAILAAYSRPGIDTITFDPGLTGTIQLVADLPIIPDDRSFSILGSGQGRITIDGGGLHDGFIHLGTYNRDLSMTIRDLTLHGLPRAIFSIADLVLSDVTVRNSGQGATLLDGFPAVVGRNATIIRVTMEGNSGVYGGALVVASSYDFTSTVTESTFINNTAHGLMTPEGLWAFGGGALYVEADAQGRVNITRSTFAGNAGALAGVLSDKNPGSTSVFVSISNSTFSGNFATQPDGAAAINKMSSGSNYEVHFSTFSGHNTGTGSGGVLKGFIFLTGSVIANNSAANPVECVNGAGGFLNFSTHPNCNGVYGMGVPTGVDPVLRNNGGLTMTHALLPGSNVIDSDFVLPEPEVENLPYCQSPLGRPYAATDQRGIARPQFGACDFGAFESNWVTLPPVNQAINGGFEASGAVFTDADGWTGVNLNAADYRRCNSVITPVKVFAGSCVFMFRGANANADRRRIIQTLPGGSWSRAGDVLRLSAQVKTRNLGAGSRLAISVVYNDGTTGAASVAIPSGTNGYRRLVVRLPLARRADSVTIAVRVETGGTNQTRLWVDNVVLVNE